MKKVIWRQLRCIIPGQNIHSFVFKKWRMERWKEWKWKLLADSRSSEVWTVSASLTEAKTAKAASTQNWVKSLKTRENLSFPFWNSIFPSCIIFCRLIRHYNIYFYIFCLNKKCERVKTFQVHCNYVCSLDPPYQCRSACLLCPHGDTAFNHRTYFGSKSCL